MPFIQAVTFCCAQKIIHQSKSWAVL